MTTLLPCPFCGSSAMLNKASNANDWWIAECSNDDCVVQPSTNFEGEDRTTTAWNTRATCEWVEVEEGSNLWNTCKEGEEFQVHEGLELWPHCHWCGGKIVAEIATQNRGSNLNKADLCSDCPPVSYPTDETRCAECPRRTTK